MRQYWIRLVFSDPRMRRFPFTATCADEQSTIEAARAGRRAERTTIRNTDAEAIEVAKRWLRLHRNAAADGPKFDRWVVISESPGTSLPGVVASGGPDAD